MHHLANEPLGDQLRREAAGHHHHGPRALRGRPAGPGRRSHDHVVFLDHGKAAAGERKLSPAVAGECGEQRSHVDLGEGIAGLGQILTEPGAEFLEVGQHRPRDVSVGLTADLELLHVEFVADQIAVGFEPGDIVGPRVGQDHFHL